jgi:hypothetical protein
MERAMTVKIDGRTFSGNNIRIVNGVVTIDGKRIDGNLSGVVRIEVEGDLASLTTDTEVHCGVVHGNVRAGMSVTCGDVRGSVDAGMSVTCGNVGGDVDARMGVTMRKG